jgi:hypothetical protein
MAKASIEVKVTHEECIEAVGSAGVTVQKVDHGMFLIITQQLNLLMLFTLAPSTKLLLGGKEPGQFNSALNDKRIKQDILHANQMKKNPAGMGIPGTSHLMVVFCHHQKAYRSRRCLQFVSPRVLKATL